MSTTYTLTKVEPYLGGGPATSGNIPFLPGSDNNLSGNFIAGTKQYVYECYDNSTPPKKIVIISPDSTLLTAGSDNKSGTNTGSIVVTDTPG